jgi:hypothetical protein
MIGRCDWAEIECFAAIMSSMVFENHGPAVEAGVSAVGFGVEECDAVPGLRLLAPSRQCAVAASRSCRYPSKESMGRAVSWSRSAGFGSDSLSSGAVMADIHYQRNRRLAK